MRRSHTARTPSSRRQLAFEPLEPRELLAADAGFDWWAATDVPVDDWSWTFDDWSSVGTGDGAWWDDSSWTGDASWTGDTFGDAASAGGTDPWGAEWAFADAGGSDWSADVGGGDAVWTDDVTPPASANGTGAGHVPSVNVVDVVAPPLPPAAPDNVVEVTGTPGSPEATVTDVVTPDVVTPDASEPWGTAGDEPLLPSPPCVILDDGAESIVQGDQFAGPGTMVSDVVTDSDVPPADLGAGVEDTVDDAGAMTDESWVIDAVRGDDVPPLAVEADGSVADLVVDGVGDESLTEPPVVIVSPVAGGKPQAVTAPVVAVPAVTRRPSGMQSSAGTPVQNRFAGWGAFFQAFGRGGLDADGSLSGGQAGGSGRPRLRLPFRPFA